MNSALQRKIKTMFPDTYFASEIATAIGRSDSTVKRWRKQGVLLPTFRATVSDVHVWLYSEADLKKAKELASTLHAGRPPKEKADAS